MPSPEDQPVLVLRLEICGFPPAGDASVTFVLDGVPTTHTTALLNPYKCNHSSHDPNFRGELYWTLDDLVAALRRCAELGLDAKLHATGDASVRQALDAAEIVRQDADGGPAMQIAHMSFISEQDLPHFAELNVAADACPFMWVPSPLTDGISDFVADETMANIWPFTDLLSTGALIAGGSDWPLPANPMLTTAIARSTLIRPSPCPKPWLRLPANPPKLWASLQKQAPSNLGSLPTSSLSTAISSPATSSRFTKPKS